MELRCLLCFSEFTASAIAVRHDNAECPDCGSSAVASAPDEDYGVSDYADYEEEDDDDYDDITT